MFQNVFSFEGRIRRTEYCLTYGLYFIAVLIVEFLASCIGRGEGIVFELILFIPIIWIRLAQGAKRCHDRGKSGWYQIIPFYELWLFFGDGEPFTNEYGPNPKGLEEENPQAMLRTERINAAKPQQADGFSED